MDFFFNVKTQFSNKYKFITHINELSARKRGESIFLKYTIITKLNNSRVYTRMSSMDFDLCTIELAQLHACSR
jgi:hypothetical protein